jgi:hypothetical protein
MDIGVRPPGAKGKFVFCVTENANYFKKHRKKHIAYKVILINLYKSYIKLLDI